MSSFSLQRPWIYRAHIHPPAIVLLVLAGPIDGDKDWPWLRELPCIAAPDGHPLPAEDATLQVLQSLGFTTSALPRKQTSQESMLLQGKVLWRVGKQEDAIATVRTVVEQAPTSFRGWYTLGASLGGMPGRQEEALAACERALALEPGAVKAWSWEGSLLKALGRWVESRAAYERALASDTEYILSWEERARILDHELQHFEEALAAYEQVAREYPDEVFMAFDIGNMLGRLGRKEDALAAYDRYLSRYPEDGDAWYNKAVFLKQLDRDEEALHCLDQALRADEADEETDPQDRADVWYQRAVVLRKLGRLEEAKQAFDQAEALAPPQMPTADQLKEQTAKE